MQNFRNVEAVLTLCHEHRDMLLRDARVYRLIRQRIHEGHRLDLWGHIQLRIGGLLIELGQRLQNRYIDRSTNNQLPVTNYQ